MAAGISQGYVVHSRPGERVTHLTTIETKPSTLTTPSKEHTRSNHPGRRWDYPDWLELRNGYSQHHPNRAAMAGGRHANTESTNWSKNPLPFILFHQANTTIPRRFGLKWYLI